VLTHLPSVAAALAWLQPRVSGALQTDSRKLRPGDAFLAWPGHRQDGRAHVAAALTAGAAACLVEADALDALLADWQHDGVEFSSRVAALPGLQAAAGPLADRWYGQPSQQMPVVAITGTNGKTSTAWWIAQALQALPQPQRCAVIGTLGIGEPPALQDSGLTTPDAVTVHSSLRQLLDAGVQACAIEASSIGLQEQRLNGLHIDTAVFTNFTQDHLDYHGSMNRYWAAKRPLFSWPGLRAAVINIDDAHGAALAAELAGQGLALWTVSLRGPASLQALQVQQGQRQGQEQVQGQGQGQGQGISLQVLLRQPADSAQQRGLQDQPAESSPQAGQTVWLHSQAVGEFNASNLLSVLGVLLALGHPVADAVAAVQQLQPVPGRMQRLQGAGVQVVVDYAHTPDALDKALQALRPGLAAAPGGAAAQLWCVFGCGGDRDRSKRALMGAVAERLADRVVLTSDNPRSEDPSHILQQILAGCKEPAAVQVMADRRQAIHHAVLQAASGDCILVAGKGHESSQEIAGIRHAFSDLDEVRTALAQRHTQTRNRAAAGMAPC